MSKALPTKPDPLSFLQTFLTQVVATAAQTGCANCRQNNHIEHIGLVAGNCFEEVARKQLGYEGSIDPDQYADIILDIKNRIGGHFSRAASDNGVIRVVNSRCPFGDAVKHAPSLCRMTSSVFGGIAARNFGYAKVELKKRIATNDGMCEVCIYTDPETARQQQGDEYRSTGANVVSQTASAAITARVEEKIKRAWCGLAGRKNFRPDIVAESCVMRKALEAVEIVAPTMATVLITGATGVGKEVIARAVHALSERWDRDLVIVNCGSIPENLIESALFGHEKGAFTSACDVHHGYFERAHNGTLFLDEIDSIPLPAQPRLLRVLQEGEFERVGGKRTMLADARVIAASNRNIKAMVDGGEFRQDLFYRLNVVPIDIPPLKERREDTLELADRFLARLSKKYHKAKKLLSEEARLQILAYDWPGNVRELENVLERAFLFTRGSVIEDIDIVAHQPADDVSEDIPTLRDVRKRAALEAEVQLLRGALSRFHGNVSDVASLMHITPRAVHMKLKQHGIAAKDYRNGSVNPRS